MHKKLAKVLRGSRLTRAYWAVKNHILDVFKPLPSCSICERPIFRNTSYGWGLEIAGVHFPGFVHFHCAAVKAGMTVRESDDGYMVIFDNQKGN